jgi:N-methylhydantoinase A
VPLWPDDDGATVAARFVAAYQARFGYALEDAAVEIVSARHAASGAARAVALARHGASAWTDSERVDDAGVLDATVRGPATIALPDATLLVRAGWTARALASGGWSVERDG